MYLPVVAVGVYQIGNHVAFAVFKLFVYPFVVAVEFAGGQNRLGREFRTRA